MVRLFQIAVVRRPGVDFTSTLEAVARELPQSHGRILPVESALLDVSATDIRARLKAGRPVRYLVPEAVEQYLLRHKLYC